MRKAFSDTLFRLADENDRVAFLTGDLGFQVFDAFRARFGPRYMNVGVAEAALVNAAAGMAMTGFRPVAYSIASFITGRAFEQIRITVDYPKLPVMLVGGGGGYTYASSGITHHAAEDLALMSLLPNTTVVAPGDPYECAQLMPQMVALDGPSYLRVGRYGEPTYPGDQTVQLGRVRTLKKGEDIAILSTGDIAVEVHVALAGLSDQNLHPSAYQAHTVKPLDVEFLKAVAAKARTLIVVEECFPAGGLAAAVASWYAANGGGPRLVRLGPPAALALGNPSREMLRKTHSYDAAGIAAACVAAFESTARSRA